MSNAAEAPAFRPWWSHHIWVGLGLWLGATIADIALVARVPGWRATHGGSAGGLSLFGFLVAFAWSLLDPVGGSRCPAPERHASAERVAQSHAADLDHPTS